MIAIDNVVRMAVVLSPIVLPIPDRKFAVKQPEIARNNDLFKEFSLIILEQIINRIIKTKP